MSELRYSVGDKVVRQGERGDTMYTVVSGIVGVQVNGIDVASLGPGEHFGELALVDELPRSADIVALEPVHLLAIERTALRDFCLVEPGLGNQILWKLTSTLGDRLRATNRMLEGGDEPENIPTIAHTEV